MGDATPSAEAQHRGLDRVLPPLFAVAGLGAALAAFGVLPAALLPWLSAPLLAGGAAWPWILRRTPVQPSPWKLLVLAGLLSPLLLATVDGLLRWSLGLDGFASLGATYALFAGSQALALGRGCGPWRTTPAIALCAAGGLALALGLGSVVFAGSAVRVSHHGLLHASILLGTERALPPGNPWMGGEPLAYYWMWHAYAGHVGRALSLAPTQALALTNVWALLWMPLSLALALAPIARCGKREVFGAFLGLFALNAWGGWRWLLASGAEFARPEEPGALLGALRGQLVPVHEGALVFDPRLAFGLSKFFNLSSYPAALGLLVGAWFAWAHALRHARAPWVGLAALLFGACALINPLVGLPAIALALTSGLLFPGRAGTRVDLGLPLLLSAVPGVAWYLSASRHLTGAGMSFDWAALAPGSGAWLGVLVPIGLLLPGALIGIAARLREERPNRSLTLFLGSQALAFAGAALVLQLPYENQYKFVRLAAVPLGLLSGLGLVDAWNRGGPLRGVAGAYGLFLCAGIALSQAFGVQAYRHLARFELPLVETAGALAPKPEPRSAAQVELAELYARLRDNRELHAEGPLLMVDVLDPEGGPWWGSSVDSGRPWKFTQAGNLQGHEAAAFSGLDLFVDRPSQALLADQARRDLRAGILQGLTAEVRIPGLLEDQLRALERPVLLLINARQVEALAARVPRAPIDLHERLEQFGFTRLQRSRHHGLYAWPPAFGERAAAAWAGERTR
ncbi:MAG: hypothetical protein ACYS26_14860 [Planctomycetota bacterium]|jgi:hypothetical protein